MMLIHLKYLLLFTIIKKTSSDSEVQVNLPNGHITFYGEAFDTPAFHTPSRGLLYKWPTFPAPTYQMTDKFQNLWNSFPSYHTNQVTHTGKPQSINGFNQIKSDPIQEKEVVKIYDEPIKVSKKKSLDFYDHDQPVEEEVRIPRQTGKNPKPNVKNISKLIRKALSLVKKVENIDERKKGIQDRLDKKTKLTSKFNQDNKDNQFDDLKQFIRSQNKISDLIRSETASLKNLIKDNPSIKTQPKKKDATKSMIEALVKLNSISSVLLNEKDATKAALKKIPNEIRRIVKLETEDLKKLIQSQNLDIQDQLQSQQEKQKISVEKRATSTKSEAVILKALAKLNKIAGVLLKDKQDRDQQEDTALAALPKLAKFIKAETTDIRDLLKEQAESSGDTDELKQSVSQSLANDKLIIKAIVTLNDITQNLLKDVNFTTSTVTSALPEALASLIKSETSKIRKMIDSQNSAITDIVEESKNLARAEKVIQEAKQIKETIFKQAKEPEIIEDGNDSNILQLISTLLPNQPAISKLIRPQTKELTRSEKLLQILAPLLTKNIQEVESEIEDPDKNKEQQLILKTQLSGQKAIVQALTKLTNITRTLLEDKAKETRQREEEFERDRSSENLNRRPSIRIDEEDYDRLRDDYEDDRRKPSRRRPSIDDYEDDRIKPSRRRPSRRKPSRRRPSDDDFYDYDDDDYEDEEEEQPKKSLAPAETGTNYLFEEFVKLAIERQRWDQAQAITSIIRDSNKPKRKKRPRFDDYDYEDDEYDDDEREKPRRRPGKRPSADYDDDFDERRESPRKSNKPKRKKRPKFEEYEYEEDYDYDRIKPKRRPGQRPVIEDYEIEEDRRQPPSRRKPSRRPSEEDIINLRTKAVRNNRRPTPRPRPVHLRPKSKPRPPPVEEVRSQVLIEYEYEEEYPVDEYPLEEYPIDDPVEPVTTTTTTTTTERPRRRPQQGNQQRNNRLRPAKKASQKIIDEPVQTSQQPENDVINEEPINRPESREPSRNIFGRNNFLRNKQQSTRDKISAKIRAQSQESVSKEDKPKFFAPTKRPTFTPRILEKQEENTQSVQNNINAIEKLKSLARENRPVTSKPSSNKASEETKTTNTKRKPEKKEVKSVPPKKPEPTQPPKEPKKVQPVNKNPGKLIIEEVQKIDEEKSTNKPKLFTESVRGSSESLSRQKPVPQNTPEKVVSKNKSRGRDRDRNPVDTIRIKDKNTDRPNTNKPPPRLSFAKPSRRRNENKDKTPANKPPLSSASNNLGNKNSDKLRENLLKALLGKRKDAQSRGSKDPIIKTSVSVSSSTSSSSSKEIVKANRRKKGRRKNSGSQIDTKIKNLTPQERLVKKVQETLNTRGTASNQPPRANNARPKPSAIDDAKPKRPKFGNPRTSHPKFGNPRAKPTVNNRGQPPRGRTDSPSSNRDALKKLFQISKTPTQSEREKVEERPNAEVNDVDSLVTNKLKKPKRGKLILRKKKPNASGRTGRQLFDGNSGTKKFRIKVKKLSKQEFSNFPTH